MTKGTEDGWVYVRDQAAKAQRTQEKIYSKLVFFILTLKKMFKKKFKNIIRGPIKEVN